MRRAVNMCNGRVQKTSLTDVKQDARIGREANTCNNGREKHTCSTGECKGRVKRTRAKNAYTRRVYRTCAMDACIGRVQQMRASDARKGRTSKNGHVKRTSSTELMQWVHRCYGPFKNGRLKKTRASERLLHEATTLPALVLYVDLTPDTTGSREAGIESRRRGLTLQRRLALARASCMICDLGMSYDSLHPFTFHPFTFTISTFLLSLHWFSTVLYPGIYFFLIFCRGRFEKI